MAGAAEHGQAARRFDPPAQLAVGVEVKADALRVQHLGPGDGQRDIGAERRQAFVAQNLVGKQHVIGRDRRAVGKPHAFPQRKDHKGPILRIGDGLTQQAIAFADGIEGGFQHRFEKDRGQNRRIALIGIGMQRVEAATATRPTHRHLTALGRFGVHICQMREIGRICQIGDPEGRHRMGRDQFVLLRIGARTAERQGQGGNQRNRQSAAKRKISCMMFGHLDLRTKSQSCTCDIFGSHHVRDQSHQGSS
jgi:hypothetical protein